MNLTSLKTCPNCSAALETDFRFCPACGQNTHLHRFDLPHIFHEAFHAFTHADKGVLQLIKSLTLRPGVTAREYILEGRRKKYFNPFTFLLLVLGFAVFVNSTFEPYGHQEAAATESRPAANRPPTNAMNQAMRHRSEVVFTFLNKHANFIAFAAIPLFTLVFWLFFKRTGINYAEHLVANVFFAGYFQLVAALVTLILSLFHLYTSTVSAQQLIFQLLYLPIGYYQFLNYRQPRQFLLTLLASILALGAWVLFSTQVIRFYIANGS